MNEVFYDQEQNSGHLVSASAWHFFLIHRLKENILFQSVHVISVISVLNLKMGRFL